MPLSTEVIEVLSRLEAEILSHYGKEDVDLFYGDWRRRAELLCDINNLFPKGATVLDAGSSPGFTSLALKLLGFEVLALDINPAPYKDLLQKQGVYTIKADLENGSIPLKNQYVDCVVFTEVLEHLHPYRIPYVLSEINRVLKLGGGLYLTTPNVASIGKRVKLLFGLQPAGKMHIKEFTAKEVISMLNRQGFKVLYEGYSLAYNMTPHNAEGKGFKNNLAQAVFKYRTKENFFHILTLPTVFTIPSLRATIKVVVRKERYIRGWIPERRF